jgi:hypothetical protein
VPKLLWICTRVKVEVIDNKTTWVWKVKSTGGKTYLSKKYKVSFKNNAHTHYKYAIFHDMVYFPDPVKDIKNPLNK